MDSNNTFNKASFWDQVSSGQQNELQHTVEVFVKEEDFSEEFTDGNCVLSNNGEDNLHCKSTAPIGRMEMERMQQSRNRFLLNDFKFVDVQSIINSSNIATSVRVKTLTPDEEVAHATEITCDSDLYEETLKKSEVLTNSEESFVTNQQNPCDESGASFPEPCDFGKQKVNYLAALPWPGASMLGEKVGELDCGFSAFISEPQAQRLETLQDSLVSSSDYQLVDDLAQISRTILPLTEEEPHDVNKETFVLSCPQEDNTVTHLTDAPFMCYICKTIFTSSATLRRHKRAHSQETHICEDCGTSFSKQSALLVHQHRHAQGKVNICSVCHKSFVSSGSLAAHKRVHSGEKPFVCECGAAFSWGVSLKKHKLSHTCDKLYSCDKCDSSSSQLNSLSAHKTSHSGVKTHLCDICNKSFVCSSQLNVHKHYHTGEKPYTGELCSADFCQKSDLQTHVYTHTHDRPYPCELCGKAFTTASSRSVHKRSHSDKRPHVCEICGATFSQAGSLTRHKVFHSDLKPYSCDECDAAFSLPSNLKRHKVIHTASSTQWSCSECERTFALASDLKQHKKTHLAKSHTCDVCQEVFSRAGNLRLHRLTHTGEKTYHCDECKAAFSQLSAWRTHQFTHSSGNTWRSKV